MSYGKFASGQLTGEGVRQCFVDGKLLRYEAQFVEGKVQGYGHYIDSTHTRCIAKWAGQGYDGPVIQTHSQGSTGRHLSKKTESSWPTAQIFEQHEKTF